MNKAILAELEWIAFEKDIPLDTLLEDFNRGDTHLRDTGTDSLVSIYTRDTPGQKHNTINVLKKMGKEKNVRINKHVKKATAKQFS